MKLEITGSGVLAIAGEMYTLQCSLRNIDQERVQWTWIGPGPSSAAIEDKRELQFHRLSKSTHSGNYICKSRIGSTTINASYHLQVNSKTTKI